jgi:hypothetical protein
MGKTTIGVRLILVTVATIVTASAVLTTTQSAIACSCPQITLKVSDLLNKNPRVLAEWPDNLVAVIGIVTKQELMDERASFASFSTTISVWRTLVGTSPKQVIFTSGASSCDITLRVAEVMVLVLRATNRGWIVIVCDQALMDVPQRDVWAAGQ